MHDELKIRSGLNEEVQEVIRTITNLNALIEGLKSVGFSYNNSHKQPLGGLTDSQLIQGYACLKTIEKLLSSPNNEQNQLELFQATYDFYAIIPHSFRADSPPLIDSTDEVKLKIDLLNTLKEVKEIRKIIGDDNGKTNGAKVNPIDRMYSQLKCDLEVLPRDSEDFKMIFSYLSTNHGPTHKFRMRIKNIFVINKCDEDKRFTSELGNKKLLWHGSCQNNICGILSNGLKISPPDAPSTGFMFGKGIYFADMASEAATYCNPKQGEKAILLLVEVALGQMNCLKVENKTADTILDGKNSTFGKGKISPDINKHLKIWNDVTVPVGRPIRPSDRNDSEMDYNQFVVYDEAQVRLRYMVQVTFVIN